MTLIPANLYAGLSDLRAYFSYTSTEATADNETLREYLTQASRDIDRYTRKKFYPHVRDLTFDHPADSRTVCTGMFFLEVLSLSANSGSQVIPDSIIRTKCGDNWNLSPYDRFFLADDSGSLFQWSGTTDQSVQGKFLLGFRSDYQLDAEAWVDSGASLTDDLAAAASVMVSGASNGPNEFGISPRIRADQIIKLGAGASQEILFVQDTGWGGTAASTRVVRGRNGTTAASHASGTQIFVWNPEPEIRMATLRLARWHYEVRSNPTGQRHFFPQFGGFELADAWPKDIRQALDRYKGLDIVSF